ncbi:MAG: EAL domain-containing protein, partial [Pseudomonadota bacterium]
VYLRDKDQRKLHKLAFYDQHTGLPNHRFFNERYLSDKFKEQPKLNLILLRLDNFKQITGAFGHQTGESYVQAVATWLVNSLARENKKIDIYQFGEVSWLIVLPASIQEIELSDLISLLLQSATAPISIDGRELSTTISIGYCEFPKQAKTINEALRNAETALLEARKASGNTARQFQLKMYVKALENIDIEHALHSALHKNELSLHWQPKYDANTCEPVSAEALLRWKYNGEYISPARFIPLAEKSGFIVDLGQWVLEKSCEQWMDWFNKGLNPLPIAVNISAIQFQDLRFSEQVKMVLDATGMPANMLELEITEEAATDKPERIIQTMNELHKIGVSIALDDFGTGYSSLS